jgi:mRNA interferase RelE/StbE
MIYKLTITRSAQKAFLDIEREIALRIKENILSLSNKPRPTGCKKLKDRDGWRIRAGNYRIIYEIDDKEKSILILHIGHRRDVYK